MSFTKHNKNKTKIDKFDRLLAEYRKLADQNNWICIPIILDYDNVRKTKGKAYAKKFITAKYYESFKGI